MRRSIMNWRRRFGVSSAVLILGVAWACGDGAKELTMPEAGDVATPVLEETAPTPVFTVTQDLSRGPIEICGNHIDDDGDGEIDETVKGGCLEGDGTPTSGDGIVPEKWTDNPACEDVGYGFGFKIEGNNAGDYTGTFTFTSADGSLTGGALEDPNNSVTITSDGTFVDWSATLGIDAVIMKGGPGSNVYLYHPEDDGDTGLATPEAGPALSHVEFCYDYEVDVTKDAETEFTRTYEWDITKDPDGDYVGFPGDVFPHEYTIDVSRTGFTDGDWAVSGSITIDNNTPFDATIERVSDAISGVGAVAVDCNADSPYALASGETLVCSYGSDLPDGSDRTNTATVETSGAVGGGDATAAVDFASATINEVNAEVNVTDDFGTPDSDGDDKTFGPLADGVSVDYSRDFVCPIDPSLYENGVYTASVTNTATIDETDDADDATVNVTCYVPAQAKVTKTTQEGNDDIGQFPFSFELYDPNGALVETQMLGTGGGMATFATELKDEGTWTVKEVLPAGWVSTTSLECTFAVAFPGSAGQTFECAFDNVEKSRVNLLKLTNGQQTTSQTWSFAIYEGPDGFEGTQVASDDTPPALLDFGPTDLNSLATYTVCELGVPAGWSAQWKVDTDGDGIADLIIPPYNPNANDEVPADLGNRCLDFGAGTAYLLPIGGTLAFEVNNSRPGGAPRTPGYWKNWNTCSTGNQPQTASKNGGPGEGWYLLDDILNDPGITWGNFTIGGCEQGVSILDQRDLDSGRKRASDAAYTLAMHLLAAQLNFAAGAATCPDAVDAVVAAEALLVSISFDGTGRYLRPNNPLYQEALALAYTLDQYNNGNLCQ
jgi:hypothetical protein